MNIICVECKEKFRLREDKKGSKVVLCSYCITKMIPCKISREKAKTFLEKDLYLLKF